jgi:hypothetical protein
MTNDPSAQIEHDLILSFKHHTIRAVMLDGVPWFLLDDLVAPLGFSESFVTRAANHADFPAHANREGLEEADDGWQTVTLISPVGVWLLTTQLDPGRGQGLAAWARREAARLCPNPQPKDPAMFLTLDDEWNLPPRPLRYSGRRSEWEDLRDHRLNLIIKGEIHPRSVRGY